MIAAFEEESKETSRPRLLLTAAVAAIRSFIDSGYQIVELSQYVDTQVNIYVQLNFYTHHLSFLQKIF